MNHTENYELGLPLANEKYDVGVFNTNYTIIDEQLKSTDSLAATHIDNHNNPHNVTKAQVGLGNVDNTSDMDKPISTATQQALNALGNKKHTYEKGTEIPANADLNTYTTVGVYQCELNVTARTMSNLPYSGNDRVAFKLIVSSTKSSACFMQIFIPYTSDNEYMGTKIAYRLYDDGSTWGMWHHLMNTEEVYYLNGLDIAHQISANEDLNDYETSGTYQCSHADIATTLANCPVSTSFKLVVDRAYTRSESEITQRITCQNNHSEMDWYRSKPYGSSTWDAWKQVASTDDITTNGYAVGTVSGSAITATINGFTLKSGVIVAIKISNEIAQACTLNINSTGAKSVAFWDNESPSGGKPIGGGRITTFIYDGTYYRVLATDRAPVVQAQNYTANTNGNVLIEWGYNVNRAQLKYNLLDDKLKWNYLKNGAWRGDVAVADYNDLITTGLTRIPANSDLDDYTTCGTYAVLYVSDAQTITNIPIQSSGKLLVIANTDSNSSALWKTQIYIPNHVSTMFLRSSSGNATTQYWLDWVELGGGASPEQLGASVAKTGKSILPIWSYPTNTRTHNGITFTFDPTTGTITVNGTATANANCVLAGFNVSHYYRIPKGEYVLSGCPSGGAGDKYFLDLQMNDGTTNFSKIDYGSGNTFTLDKDVESSIALTNNYFIEVKSGQTVSNLVFKPMLCPAFSTADYEPCEDIHKGNCYVGTCTTAGDVKDKEAYVDGYFVLRKGVQVAIKFTNTNSYSSSTTNPITLNVNNTGAKQIWYNTNSTSGGGATGTASWIFGLASRYIYYIYDGTYWIWAGHGSDNSNTNYLRNDASSTLTAQSPELRLKASNIDITQANNNVSNVQYPAYIIQDKNGKTMSRLESVVNPNGDISTFLYTHNYDYNTQNTALGGIKMTMTKALQLSYTVYAPERFNVALGNGYAVDSRSSAVAAVTATLNYYVLVPYGLVTVKFNYDVPANATLSINGQGVKNIYYHGSAIKANIIKAGDKATFVYTGSYDLVAVDRGSAYAMYDATLAAGATTVTFTGLPTSGNNLFDVYTSKAGLNYTAIDDSTSGQLKLTYPAQSSAVTVYLKIQQA